MATWQHGQLIEFDGLLAVVVGNQSDNWVPEEHAALWFGTPQGERKSKGGQGGLRPLIWTVPEDLCTEAAAPIIQH